MPPEMIVDHFFEIRNLPTQTSPLRKIDRATLTKIAAVDVDRIKNKIRRIRAEMKMGTAPSKESTEMHQNYLYATRSPSSHLP